MKKRDNKDNKRRKENLMTKKEKLEQNYKN